MVKSQTRTSEIDIPVVICRRCKKPKLPSQLRKKRKSGLHKICKPCSAAEAMAWASSHPDKKKAADARYHRQHRDEQLRKQKKYYYKNREHFLEYGKERLKKYPWIHRSNNRRINLIGNSKSIRKLKEIQNNCCAICSVSGNQADSLATDHDHLTGEPRGLLCTSCNHAIGFLMDDTNLLRNAISYLESPPARIMAIRGNRRKKKYA